MQRVVCLCHTMRTGLDGALAITVVQGSKDGDDESVMRREI
jgi:hypothetical protein